MADTNTRALQALDEASNLLAALSDAAFGISEATEVKTAWLRTEAVIALAEKASKVIEAGMGEQEAKPEAVVDTPLMSNRICRASNRLFDVRALLLSIQPVAEELEDDAKNDERPTNLYRLISLAIKEVDSIEEELTGTEGGAS
jgi:hypothetical protein